MIQTAARATTTQRAGQQIEANLREVYDARRARDEAPIRIFFIDRDDLLIWGTDAFERIAGRVEADRDFAKWIATCPPWTALEPTHRVMGIRDGLVWVADEVLGRWASVDQEGVADFRVTTIWEERDGSWTMIHANVATPH